MEDFSDCEILKDDSLVPDMLYKVIIIGDAGVGKSCILYRAIKGEFKDRYEVTIGAEYNSFIVRIKGKVVKLQVWDTAGQEGFKSMTRIFYKGSHCAIVVYDVTKSSTFSKVEEWIGEIKENATVDAKICLVGNQKDKKKQRQIDTSVAQEFANSHALSSFIETSAKTGEGITELFLFIAKILYLEHDTSEASKLERGYLLDKSRVLGKHKPCC